MAVTSGQVTISSASVTAIPVSLEINVGALMDPIPAQIKNIDAAITIYVGGPTVSLTTGYPLGPGVALSFGFIAGDGNTLYALAASGSPKIAYLVLRH